MASLRSTTNTQGLDRAVAAGVKSVVVPHQDYASREAFETAMQLHLEENQVELVCLAGFMR